MKKKVLLMMVMMSLLCLFGCGNKANGEGAQQNTEETQTNESVKVDVKDATELLTNVWSAYEEAERFPVGGGDYDNIVMDAPGKYDVSKAEEMDSVLGLPQDSAALIDDAASMMHMMNANTFTGGVYHVADTANQDALIDSLKDNIMSRQWICGFPDTLIIAKVGGEYVVSAFGNAEIIETFKTNLKATFEMTDVVVEESLTE